MVHGMKQYKSTDSPPAKRLFLIVGDGLRADTTFDHVVHPTTGKPEFLAPYIRNLVKNEATYGISHTRMPTESRPGHVAIIAGFYEDVSAVTKGWKENPVEFDSVFNQSVHTYSFGSPDILPMFKEGSNDKSKIDTWMYGHELEDFTQSSIELDAFVFEHLYQLFNRSSTNASLNTEIRRDGNVFFLHLLGCDTAGHSYRPYSAEYYDNVKYIDDQISRLVPKVHEFFGDEKTAFILTADHGMSAFGSHGDGHPNNTRTPLVAWGAGLNKPVKDEKSIPDNYTKNWDLADIKRFDVNQADIAPLMSYLVGSNYPSNSVGELPLDYINGNEVSKLKAIFANAKEILEQYLISESEVRNNQIKYKKYPKFEKKPHSQYVQEIEALITRISNGETILTAEAISLTKELIKVTLEGLHYLTIYNRLLLIIVITIGFLGWILYSFTFFLKVYILQEQRDLKPSIFNYLTTLSIGSSIFYFFYHQKSPFNYYMYVFFPLFFWSNIFMNSTILNDGIIRLFNGTYKFQKFTVGILTILMYQGIVCGFSRRWVFTVIFNVLGFYPLLLGIKDYITNISWIATSVVISMFTLFDPVKIESLTQINLGGLLITLSGAYGFYVLLKYTNNYTRILLSIQIATIIATTIVTNKAVSSLQNRTGLPKDCRIASWALLVVTLVFIPLLHFLKPTNHFNVRILIIYLTLAPFYIILTISFESFFYFIFTAYVLQWVEIESKIRYIGFATSKPLNSLQILRVSVIGFFLLQVAFFATGNVASISSFSLDSVYRLVPVFDPISMGALLVLKLFVPYIILSTVLGLMNIKLHIKKYTITSLIISTNDILSLNFFYLLKTEGSWLDIGISISNYCLAILCSLFILVLEVISRFLLRNVDTNNVLTASTANKHN